MVNLDLSALSGYYAARSTPRGTTSTIASTSHSALAKPLPAGITPPWERAQPQGKGADTTKLKQALDVKNFVDESDETFNRPGVSRDQKKLFALYKGLQALQTLAQRAGDTKTSDGERNGLARRFAAGFEEIRASVAKGGFDDLSLLFGDKSHEAKSELSIPRSRSEYQGNLIVTGTADDALAGVSSADSITVNVLKGGATTPITLNFSEITGDISVNSVISALNQKMADAGMLTRFRRQEQAGKTEDSAKRYGFNIEGVASERVSLSAKNAQASLTIVGSNGTGSALRGQITKLSSLDGAIPASVASEKIEPKDGVSDARATASDGQGNSYVVGTVTGDLGSGIVQGSQDVYLRKYDSANNLVWSRLLGSADHADAFALAVDADGNAVVAGRVRDKLTTTATGGGDDSFVAKYDASGLEVFTRQVSAVQDDQANALAVDATGNIFVGGYTRGKLGSGGVTATGTDAYIQKMSATGTLISTRQFGAGADERVSSLAIGSDGGLIAASVENGTAIVRKLDASDIASAPVWEVNAGALDGGSLSNLAVRDGGVYLAGTTTNAALASSVVNAHSGGSDAFVLRIADAGTSAATDFVTYVGSSGAEGGGGLAVTSDAIYLTGSTRAGLPGQNAVESGKIQGFVQKLSLSGALGWNYQYAGADGHAAALSVAVDSQGGSVLDALGLPRGEVSTGGSRLITAQSTVRVGDFFTIQLNDQPARKITVRTGDTMRALASRVNLVLGLKGEAIVSRERGGDALKLTIKDDSTLTIKAGTGGQDALAGLGLTPGALYGKNVKAKATSDDDLKTLNSFALRLSRDLNLGTDSKARLASSSLSGAIEAVKQASKRLVDGPPPPAAPERRNDGPAPAYLSARNSSYQTALLAFGSNGDSGNLGSF